MAFQSFGDCPWCGARIDLRKEGRDYACPVCGCTFKRNSGKWKVGIPLALLIAVPLWIFVPVYGRLAAFLGLVAVLIVTAATSRHEILSRGRSDLTAGEARQHKAKWKESKWFYVVIGAVLAAALVLLTLLVVLMAKR